MIDKELLALPGVRKKFPILAALAIGQAVVILGQAFCLSAAVVGFWQGRSFLRELPFVAGFFLLFMGREGVNFLRARLLDDFAYGLAQDLRQQLLLKIFRLGPAVASDKGTGSLTATAISSIDQIEMYIKLVLSKMLNMMIMPVLFLIAIFILDWESGAVLLVAFPFAVIFMILLGYAAQARASRQYANFQLLSNHFLDSLRGIATLKYFGLSKSYAQSIYRTSERFRKATMSTLRMAMLSTFALDFFATLSVATVALFLGLRLLDGTILLFPALATLILAPEYFLPLREFASDYHATLNGKNALAAVNELFSRKEEGDAASEESLKRVTLSTAKSADERSSLTLKAAISWSEQSTLSLSALTKTYEAGSGVQNVSVRFDGFQKVALVGASGAGKSTLLNLLAGFLSPTSGEMSLNGERLTTLSQELWRQSLSFIPQNTYIFSDSLRNNLAFYQPLAKEEEILSAARLAGLTDLVEAIGLETKIGAGGRTLSGGQMQRVALARAFLSADRNILLLDEPTAHLDIETELEIKEAILPLFEQKLVFLATHRLHWLPQMDKIIMLKGGQVMGIGSHEDLLADNTYYQALLRDMRGEGTIYHS